MDILAQLGIALGLGSLAGLNLYLTVLMAGLAVNFNILQLADKHAELAVLGHPAVIGVAAVLFAMEFFADKIPWVDSGWDAIHTLIRPAGAVLVALPALGQVDPSVAVIGALVAAMAASTLHGAKAGTRLIANTSPEPVSNIGLSLAEDAAVIGGFALIAWNPIVALGVFAVVIGGLWFLMPRLIRVIKSSAYLAMRVLRRDASEVPAKTIPAAVDMALHESSADDTGTVDWAVPCVSGASLRWADAPTSNQVGTLVAYEGGERSKLYFVGKKWFRRTTSELDIAGCEVAHEPRFLSEDLVIYSKAEKRRVVLRFPKGSGQLVDNTFRALCDRSAGAPAITTHDALEMESV